MLALPRFILSRQPRADRYCLRYDRKRIVQAPDGARHKIRQFRLEVHLRHLRQEPQRHEPADKNIMDDRFRLARL